MLPNCYVLTGLERDCNRHGRHIDTDPKPPRPKNYTFLTSVFRQNVISCRVFAETERIEIVTVVCFLITLHDLKDIKNLRLFLFSNRNLPHRPKCLIGGVRPMLELVVDIRILRSGVRWWVGGDTNCEKIYRMTCHILFIEFLKIVITIVMYNILERFFFFIIIILTKENVQSLQKNKKSKSKHDNIYNKTICINDRMA